jgi:hypothetical protein
MAIPWVQRFVNIDKPLPPKVSKILEPLTEGVDNNKEKGK